MNPIPMLRQQFLRGLGGTLGLAALSKLSEPSALATPVATENAPPSPFQHHAPKAKRIIYLFRSVRLEAGSRGATRRGSSRFDPPGTTIDDDDLGAIQIPSGSDRVSFFATWKGRNVV